MSLTEILSQYGYLAIFIGSILEGESVLTLAGFLVHQGYLSLPLTIIFAACGGSTGDLIFFILGRYYGKKFISRFPHFAPQINRITHIIESHQTGLILGIRFMYGFRMAAAIAIGMSKISLHRFIMLNLLSGMLWAALFVSLGYTFGQTIEWLFKDIEKYEGLALFIFITAITLLLFFIHRQAKKRP